MRQMAWRTSSRSRRSSSMRASLSRWIFSAMNSRVLTLSPPSLAPILRGFRDEKVEKSAPVIEVGGSGLGRLVATFADADRGNFSVVAVEMSELGGSSGEFVEEGWWKDVGELGKRLTDGKVRARARGCGRTGHSSERRRRRAGFGRAGRVRPTARAGRACAARRASHVGEAGVAVAAGRCASAASRARSSGPPSCMQGAARRRGCRG